MAMPEVSKEVENCSMTLLSCKNRTIQCDQFRVIGDKGDVQYLRNGMVVAFVNRAGCCIMLDDEESSQFEDIRVWLVWTADSRFVRVKAECCHPEPTGFATLRANGEDVAFVTQTGIVGCLNSYARPVAC